MLCYAVFFILCTIYNSWFQDELTSEINMVLMVILGQSDVWRKHHHHPNSCVDASQPYCNMGQMPQFYTWTNKCTHQHEVQLLPSHAAEHSHLWWAWCLLHRTQACERNTTACLRFHWKENWLSATHNKKNTLNVCFHFTSIHLKKETKIC